ncbi:HlyD family secretion protein [Paenibacillus anaericanus]|uniref:efflux RND transporter periplasmic adaptor subunit n=1 Tax=Paenibacillus anaericanus TaxID=170367 RepID=UPI002789B730|nr:biotin/lipoyl-binding protein [Paenibacillus anaericanus]MDQ0089065.1 HlyD family secretion protein [Paenibacillus anaericanus]
MDVRTDELAAARLKRRMRIALSLFLGILLILTLYSNTLLSMNLPKVWIEEGIEDQLVQNYRGSGIMHPRNEVELLNKQGWNVKSIKVKEGDRVTKGQILVTYDSREAENRIQDQQVNLERQELIMEGLQDRYIEATQSGDEMNLRNAKRDIDLALLDKSIQERNLNNLQTDLENYSKIVAPFDGVVTKIAAVKGMPSGSAGSDVIVSNTSLGYQLELQIPSSIIDAFKLGEKLPVQVQIRGVTQSLEGTIDGIENLESVNPTVSPTDEGEGSYNPLSINPKRVLVAVKSSELQGGEQASIELNKSSMNDKGFLLPNKAIHGEGEAKYIFVLEEKKSPLGNTYHASKVQIEVGGSNAYSTVVLKGSYPGQSVIVESSEPLQDGTRVRLK